MTKIVPASPPVLGEDDGAPMGAHEIGGDGEAETGAAWACCATERFEQASARTVWQTGSGIGDLDLRCAVLASGRDA